MEIPPLDRDHREPAQDRHRQDPTLPPAGTELDTPFVHCRRLTFGDTDAARIIYTPRVAHFIVEAIEAWFLERIDISWLHVNRDHGFGTPVVKLEIDFLSMLRPPDFLDTELALQKIGRSSLTFRLTGRVGTRLCYRATCVNVFASADAGRSVPIPECYRPAIERELAISKKVLSADDADERG